MDQLEFDIQWHTKDNMSKGSETLIKKYGKDYFSRLGKRGAKRFYQLYYLMPVDLNRFAIMRKEDNSFVNYLGYNRSIGE